MNAETRAKETCEQRARDITALMVKKLPGTDIALVMEDQAKCVSLITQALRQAENDKLEEAARMFEADDEILEAASIRSLKSKD